MSHFVSTSRKKLNFVYQCNWYNILKYYVVTYSINMRRLTMYILVECKKRGHRAKYIQYTCYYYYIYYR
jgi:hypothetical protein